MESEADQSIFKLVRGRPNDSPENRKSILLIDHTDLALRIYDGDIPSPDKVSFGKTPLQNLHKFTLRISLRLQCDFQVTTRGRVRHSSVSMRFETAKDRKTMIRTVKKLLSRTHRFGVDNLFVRSNTGQYDHIVKEARPVDLRALGFSDSEESKGEGEGALPVHSQVGEGASTSAQESTKSLPHNDTNSLQEELRLVKEQVQVQQAHVASLVVALITGSRPPPPGTDTDPWNYLTAFDLGPEEVAALQTHQDFEKAADARRKRFPPSREKVKGPGEYSRGGRGAVISEADSPEQTQAEIAATKELGWMACAPAVKELVQRMPKAGWAEMRQVKEVLLQEPEAGQDYAGLVQLLQSRYLV